MDGAKIVGLTMGAVGMAVEVTKDFAKAYEFYCRGKSMPEDYKYLILQMQFERQRFLTFCRLADLKDVDNPQLCVELREYKTYILGIFEQMRKLFVATEKYHLKYRRHVSSDLVNDSSMGPEIIDNLGIATIFGLEELVEQPDPVRLSLGKRVNTWSGERIKTIVDTGSWTWASGDYEHLTELNAQLTRYNKILRGLLNDRKQQQLEQAIDAVRRMQIQLSKNISSLLQMDQALEQPQQPFLDQSSLIPPAILSENGNRHADPPSNIQEMVQIKMLYQQNLNLTPSGIIRAINQNKPLNQSLLRNHNRPHSRRSFATLGNEHVWIDWKDPEIIEAGDELHKNRIRLLVDLIRKQTIESFRAPVCLGYIQQKTENGETEYGVVFKIPSRNIQLKSLRQLINGIRKPSWPDRIVLCSLLVDCIYNFHTIGWVHKSIRSENIVFMTKSNHEIDYSQPFLIGFDLSRPAEIQELTMKPAKHSPFEEIYRHPNAQRTVDDSGYRRSYDLYSLALVFIEIAFWEPIEDFFNISDLGRLTPEQLTEFKDRLTKSPQYRQELLNVSRDTFTSIVYDCLGADQIDKPNQGESDDVIAMKLQNMENVKLVKKLQALSKFG